MLKKILVTGGAGYIGSHTCVEMIKSGRYEPIVYDNLSNSSEESLVRVERITGHSLQFIKGDIRDSQKLDRIFKTHNIDAVVHFAGLKSVGESVERPMRYYDNNIAGSIVLFNVMKHNHVERIVFSSSATVYGDPARLPIQENFPLSATNAYGRSKLFIEMILSDIQQANPHWSVTLLRYFNPVGAHKSGMIGEDPNDTPNNLMPYISRVALGQYPQLSIFGGDYPTSDGTGVRDFIHVVDLAKGHVKALNAFERDSAERLLKVNLGTGEGYSVLQLVDTFKKVSGREIPYKIIERRPGDVASCYADASFAKQVLGWQAELGVEAMCQDTWRWQQMNPNGYQVDEPSDVEEVAFG